MRFTLLISISVFLTLPSNAQDPYSTGTCSDAQAETILEVGDVRARLFNNGGLFWKSSLQPIYSVPQGSDVDAFFSSILLVAGMIDDEVRAAGSTYGPFEFWPGPMPADGSPPMDCSQFERFWTVDRLKDVIHSRSSTAAQEWPVHLGAPYIDHNGTVGYQPSEGDQPSILGDRQVWWVMNDRGNVHRRFRSKPLGIEVQVAAFGFDSSGDLGNATFYRYRIENKGTSTIREMAVGQHVEVDVGDFKDDRLGTDTTHAMLYFYNADNEDDQYASSPPAVGVSILEASHSRGILPTDLDLSPSRHLSATMQSTGSGGPSGGPDGADELHHFLAGRTRNGEARREGGYFGIQQYGAMGAPTTYVLPGDPVTGSFWSELNAYDNGGALVPSDRTGVLSFGTFDLAPGEWASFTFAYLWARGNDHIDSIRELRNAAHLAHINKEIILSPLSAGSEFSDGNPPETPQHPFWVDEPYPNPADDRLTLRASFDKTGPVSVRISDMLGRTRLEQTHQATSTGEQSITLDTFGLTPGSYTVTVESWSHRASHPFVVLR